MKNATRVLPFVLLMLILTAFTVSAGNTNRETVSISSNNITSIGESFDKMPMTLEAWLSLPVGYSERGGTVIGNYKTSSYACLNFEIHKSGRPRIYINDEALTNYDVIFDKVNLLTGKPIMSL